jgi:inner membrane protein
MIDAFSFAAIVGYLGAITNMLWPVFRSRRAMLLAQVAGAFLFAIHFFLLGALTASILITVAGVQAILAVPLGSKPRFRLVYLATVPLIAGIMIYSWQGLPSLFASLGLATISVGRYQLNIIRFRLLLVACIPLWIAHNLMVGSIPGLISDAVSITAGAWMLVVAAREERFIKTVPSNPAVGDQSF